MKIISELCQNHNGDMEILEAMIKSASEHSSILKIQTIIKTFNSLLISSITFHFLLPSYHQLLPHMPCWHQRWAPSAPGFGWFIHNSMEESISRRCLGVWCCSLSGRSWEFPLVAAKATGTYE